MRPMSLSHSGAAGPRPITQSELATALALASTPDSSAVTPTTSSQVRIVESDGQTAGTYFRCQMCLRLHSGAMLFFFCFLSGL